MPIDESLRDEMLRSITMEGASSEENKDIKIVIGNRTNSNSIVDFASGLPKVRSHILTKFDLILSQPLTLQALSPLAIRCCLCGRVISYPVWYHNARYAVNWFHYFICFDSHSPSRPSARCYRRII